MSKLSHFDDAGASRMVDVGVKKVTLREARAVASVTMRPETLALIQDRRVVKGDVFEVARLAGIMACKQTGQLIPLCHPLQLDHVRIDFEVLGEQTVQIEAVVSTHGRTGVEMEALMAVSIAGLTIYDMCKSVDRGMVIGPVELIEKSGGKSGSYLHRTGDSPPVTAASESRNRPNG